MKPVLFLIDDEKTVLESLLNQLRRAYGYRFKYETATDVEEAMELLAELINEGSTVALIISDWLMPKQKGDQFLIEVYKHYPSIVQIMLSGFADEEAIDNAKNYANLKAFVRKPWEEEELIKIISDVLGIE